MHRCLFPLCLTLSAPAQALLVGGAAIPTYAGRYSVAPGSLIVVIPSVPVKTTDPSTIRLEMLPRGATNGLPMTVIALKSGWIWALTPADAPFGRATVTMTADGITSSGSMFVAISSFGLFSALYDGSGPAIAQNITSGGVPVLNQLTTPALPGQYMTLWGTGIGDFTTGDVSIDVYGTTVRATYAGHAPGQLGLDQINFQLPADVPAGCYVPVTVTVAGDDVSNTVTLATAEAPGVPCKHPLGLSADQLKTLDQGGRVIMGSLSILSVTAPDPQSGGFSRSESAEAQFRANTAAQAFPGPMVRMPDVPSCVFNGVPAVAFLPVWPDPDSTVFAEAGAALALSGPGQRALTLANSGTTYSKAVDPVVTGPTIVSLGPTFFIGGSWTLTSPGGADVSAFQQTFALPVPLNWTNRETLNTIDRSRDLLITWDNEGNAPSDTVRVSLLTFPPEGGALPTGYYAGIDCTVAVRVGQLAIPRSSLQKVTPTLSGFSSRLSVGVSSDDLPPRLSVPVVGGGTAPLVVGRWSAESLSVIVQ